MCSFGPRELLKPEEKRPWLLSSARCAGLLAAASRCRGHDSRRGFGRGTVCGPSQLDGMGSIFFGRHAAGFRVGDQFDTGAMPCRRLAAESCSTWRRVCFLRPVASGIKASTGVDTSAAFRLVSCGLPGSASHPASEPFPAPWHVTGQQKPRVAAARNARMAERSRTAKGAARLVR